MARGAGLPAFYAHLRRVLGREPTEADIAAAIATTEANPISGQQDAYDILSAIYNRSRAEGGIDARAYDGVSFRHNPGTKRSLLGNITKESMAPFAAKYRAYQAGEAKPSHPHTHYFHPSGMRAIYERNPRAVRSSPWRTIVWGDKEIRTPTPNWFNPKAAYFGGSKHAGMYTTPTHLVGKVGPSGATGAAGSATPAPAPANTAAEYGAKALESEAQWGDLSAPPAPPPTPTAGPTGTIGAPGPTAPAGPTFSQMMAEGWQDPSMANDQINMMVNRRAPAQQKPMQMPKFNNVLANILGGF